MHPAASEFVAAQVAARGPFDSVVEVGSRDINGTVRQHFGPIAYVGLDLYDGPGVDWVGDARDYEPPELVDAVVCCEVLEHFAAWPGLMRTVAGWLRPRGVLIVTCAGPGRRPHSAIDGGWIVHPGEHYLNVSAARLGDVLRGAGFATVEAREVGKDTQAVALA